MIRRGVVWKLAFTVWALAGVSSAALADVIDGHWCRGASSFTIEGPTIITPGGNRIGGKHTRHSFSYIVPANETGAGTEVAMMLQDEETLRLLRDGVAETEIWRRCKVTS